MVTNGCHAGIGRWTEYLFLVRSTWLDCIFFFGLYSTHNLNITKPARPLRVARIRSVQMDITDHDDESSMRPVRQLWSTQIQHMQQNAATHADVGFCVCCVRPILITDVGTRKMSFCSLFVDMLQNCCADKTSLLYTEQCRLLRQGFVDKYILVCFICLPSWKKSILQHENKQRVETPSLFMHRSNAFLHDSSAVTDKLSLLKYVLCATSEVVVGANKEKVNHPMRNTDFVVLEAVIFFFRHLFVKYRCNVRIFSRMFCHFQIVSIVRWHVTGFPLMMTQNRQTQDLRKALRGSIGKLYHEAWQFEDDFMTIQRGTVSDANECHICAACVHRTHVTMQNTGKSGPTIPTVLGLSPGKPEKKLKSYDTFFLKDWKYICEQIQHMTASESVHTAVLPRHGITCRSHLKKSVVSYLFYHKISHRFPKKFRQRNIKRYYNRLMNSTPEAVETPVGTNSVASEGI